MSSFHGRHEQGKAAVRLQVVGRELPQRAGFDGFPQAPHQAQIEMQVVQRVQAQAQCFSACIQVAQIGTAVVAAGKALTPGVDGFGVVAVALIADADRPAAGKQLPVACIAGRHDAIEHIHAQTNGFHDVFGLAYTHEVARFAFRHVPAERLKHGAAQLGAFAHRQAAYAESRKIQFFQPFQRLAAKIVIHASLHNAENGFSAAFGIERFP